MKPDQGRALMLEEAEEDWGRWVYKFVTVSFNFVGAFHLWNLFSEI